MISLDAREARENPVILTFVHYYLPAYKAGGPVRTISNMVEHLGHEFDFRIVASDRDSFDEDPFTDVTIDKWSELGDAKVFYASPGNRGLRATARIMRSVEHDTLYLNSFFAWQSTVMPLLARLLRLAPRRPTIIAPRGEFSAGALQVKSFKKRAFIWIARTVGLYDDVIWQASSAFEAEDIRASLISAAPSIVVAPDLSPRALPTRVLPDSRPPSEPLRIAFLSRVSPMKNLDYALRVLSDVRVPVVMKVYGVVDDEQHWQRCQKLISDLPSHVAVSYEGIVEHNQVHEVLGQYDLFFLPTRGENFGHAIIEALSAGVPALISDQTPWRDLEAHGAGWALPLDDPSAFVTVIEKQAAISGTDAGAQGECARAYAERVLSDSSVVAANRELILAAIEHGRLE